ncbi:MAG: hypothetical protein JO256_03175 [Alphaproteobacteria bacterium]|nr:hypothetical protein [Alphaproteobacteria bacterium]
MSELGQTERAVVTRLRAEYQSLSADAKGEFHRLVGLVENSPSSAFIAGILVGCALWAAVSIFI